MTDILSAARAAGASYVVVRYGETECKVAWDRLAEEPEVTSAKKELQLAEVRQRTEQLARREANAERRQRSESLKGASAGAPRISTAPALNGASAQYPPIPEASCKVDIGRGQGSFLRTFHALRFAHL